MKIIKQIYEHITKKKAPYYFDYSFSTIIKKPIRKWMTNVLAANCPFNNMRILIYRMCGFKIGKNCFIGMRCYLDDMCYDLITVKDNCTISYGVYFACHGRNQAHLPIVIEENAYIGMRASIITKTGAGEGIVVGRGAVVGACTLVK